MGYGCKPDAVTVPGRSWKAVPEMGACISSSVVYEHKVSAAQTPTTSPTDSSLIIPAEKSSSPQDHYLVLPGGAAGGAPDRVTNKSSRPPPPQHKGGETKNGGGPTSEEDHPSSSSTTPASPNVPAGALAPPGASSNHTTEGRTYSTAPRKNLSEEFLSFEREDEDKRPLDSDSDGGVSEVLFPSVEVSIATRKVVTSWARWAMNRRRLELELRYKRLQNYVELIVSWERWTNNS